MKQKIKSRIYGMAIVVIFATTFATTSYLNALPAEDQLTDHADISLYVLADVTKRDTKGFIQNEVVIKTKNLYFFNFFVPNFLSALTVYCHDSLDFVSNV